MKDIYLDNSATTPLLPEVKDKVIETLDVFGNPSSLYETGDKAHQLIEDSRKTIADVMDCNPNCIVFMSGGSESDNAAIIGAYDRCLDEGKNHIITTKIEHKAVLNTCRYLEAYRGAKVTYLDVDKSGMIDLHELRESITDKTALISVMSVNNEIGTLQPIESVSYIARENGVLFHCDNVQGFMHENTDYSWFDIMSVSGHKFGAMKGVGFLYIKEGVLLPSFIHGGDQELGRRAGTSNTIGIVSLAEAVKVNAEHFDEWSRNTRDLTYYLRSRILAEIPGTTLNGPEFARSSNNVNISFHGVRGETLMILLDSAHIQCSTGSACNSSSAVPSYVLKAIGLSDDKANSSIRFSLSHENTKEQIDYVVDRLKDCVELLRGNN